jgi:hypothetical protein
MCCDDLYLCVLLCCRPGERRLTSAAMGKTVDRIVSAGSRETREDERETFPARSRAAGSSAAGQTTAARTEAQ